MKKFLSITILTISLAACAPRLRYLPVEQIKLEYRDRILRDSIYLRDSVAHSSSGDTVYIERFRYRYRDRVLRDTLRVVERESYPVPVSEGKGSAPIWAVAFLSCIVVCLFLLYRLLNLLK